MMVNFVEYKSRAGLANGLAAIVAGQLAQILEEKDRATLAVPGGTTPGPFLRALAQASIDWRRVSVLLTDERFVSETSDRSNTKLLRETLLQGPAAKATLVPMVADAQTPEEVLDQLSATITKTLPLDICVLGMGSDMHTASIFPGADLLEDALDINSDKILLPMRAPGSPEPRLTLTAQVLRAAATTHILIAGQDKKHALKKAELPGSAHDAPIRSVLNGPGDITIHFAE